MDVRGAPHSIINSGTAVLIHNAGDPAGLGARPVPSAAHTCSALQK